jgi:hypothetical protein
VYPEVEDVLEMTTATREEGTYPALVFANPESVYTPDGQEQIVRGSDERTTPAPGDIVTWLRNHPDLDVSKPAPVMIGGVSGVRLDVKVSPVPENYSVSCGGNPCIFLFPLEEDEVGGLALWANDKNRLIVLEDVEGETVIIAIGVPANFQGFLPKAQAVLDTVEWEAGS